MTRESKDMMILIIAILCVLDIIARTYITKDGICYETPSGKMKQITGRKRGNAWQNK